jgi:hypothetical protein
VVISFQDETLAALERVAAEFDATLVQVGDWSNTGRVLARFDQRTVATAEYHFQHGHNTVVFNCEPQASMRKLGTADGFLFAEHEDGKITAMYTRWRTLLREGRDHA